MGIGFYWGVLAGLCFRLVTAMAAMAKATAMTATMTAYISIGDSESEVGCPVNLSSTLCVLK